ncbi:hypothetical protein AKJ16_DCAP04337 [Drosera capensis]
MHSRNKSAQHGGQLPVSCNHFSPACSLQVYRLLTSSV